MQSGACTPDKANGGTHTKGVDVATHVFIIDDNASYRRVARAVVDVADGFEWCGDAADAASARDQLASMIEVASDIAQLLVLVDVNLGHSDGVTLTSELVARYRGLRVVLISTMELDDLPASAKASGAIGFLPKVAFGPASLASLEGGAYSWAT